MTNAIQWLHDLFGGKIHTGFKAIGNGVWVAAFTNNFQDSHGEIITAQAHDRYVARVKAGLVPMPELWHWHKEGTRHGEAVWIEKVGDHMVVAIGRFDETPEGAAAEDFYQKNKGKYELSHGFFSPKWAIKQKVIHDYVTYEISTLPIGKAANQYTTFEEVTAMPVTQEQKDSITAMFKDAAPAVLQQIADAEKGMAKAQELGAKYKSYVDPTGDPVDDEVEDISKAGSLPIGVAAVLETILKQQSTHQDLFTGMDGALSAIQKVADDDHKAMETELVAIRKLRTQLEGEVALQPKRVRDAIVAAQKAGELESVEDLDDDEDDETLTEAQKAAANKELEERSKGAFDPAFPGMKIPVSQFSKAPGGN